MVEIKKDDDDSKKNKAKYRDGLKHFSELNSILEAKGNPQRYHFKFLTPKDYTDFFQSVRDGKHREWKSSLMNDLEQRN